MSRTTFRQVAARIAAEALQDLPNGTSYKQAQYALDQVSPLQSGNSAEVRIWAEERRKAMQNWRLSRQSRQDPPENLFSS